MTTKRRQLVAGNWKMNGSRTSIQKLVAGLIEAGPFDCDVIVLPSFVFLAQVKQLIVGSDIGLGAQNLHWQSHGAFTGEISAPMLVEAGAKYCLVGHSERRTLFGESDEQVADKFGACLAHGLIPILCFGETLAEREAGQTMAVVKRQLDAVLAKQGIAGFAGAVLAYEPVWAIGTGESATPEQAEEVHAGVREMLAGWDRNIAEHVRVLYGGSVNGENAGSLLGQENIDGALVGGASLKADEFATICRFAVN